MESLFFESFRRQVIRPEGHWFDTIRHFCISCCDCDILQQVFKFFAKGDSRRTNKRVSKLTSRLVAAIWIVVSDERVLSTNLERWIPVVRNIASKALVILIVFLTWPSYVIIFISYNLIFIKLLYLLCLVVSMKPWFFSENILSRIWLSSFAIFKYSSSSLVIKTGSSNMSWLILSIIFLPHI